MVTISFSVNKLQAKVGLSLAETTTNDLQVSLQKQLDGGTVDPSKVQSLVIEAETVTEVLPEKSVTDALPPEIHADA